MGKNECLKEKWCPQGWTNSESESRSHEVSVEKERWDRGGRDKHNESSESKSRSLTKRKWEGKGSIQ